MRMLYLSVLLFAALSACDKDSASPRNQVEHTTPHRTRPVDADSHQAKPSGRETGTPDHGITKGIPAPFQGRWTGADVRCTDAGADLELTITPDRLIFHESVGTVTKVTHHSGDRLAIDAAFSGEGQSWTRRLTLRAGAGGKTLTISNDGQTIVRKRCSDPA